MKHADLIELGYPQDCLGICIETLQKGFREKVFHSNRHAAEQFALCIGDLPKHQSNEFWQPLVDAVMRSNEQQKQDEATWGNNPLRQDDKPVTYARWGADIEQGALDQMQMACELPVTVAAAMMPDAHLGYGLPIGGVLATYDAVIPYAVGVDISCQMKLTITDLPPTQLDDVFKNDITGIEAAIQKGTVFGKGGSTGKKLHHPVLDQDWKITEITAQMHDRAWDQLGTSGSGNHCLDVGVITLHEPMFGLDKGNYMAILSHSGSRGAGANVCKVYSDIAMNRLPKRYERFKNLAWLPMSSEAGQEYWAAMHLMGDYASANHAIIHERVLQLMGGQALATIENKHNLCWLEEHNGQKVYVHRKGATPAGKGVLGIIPGTMADPCYLVRGKGEHKSLLSASHGAGRAMSRTKAREKFSWKEWNYILQKRNVKLISAGIDEVPGSYKEIRKVMQEQSDLVEIVGEFMPRVVKMADDGTAED